MEEELRQKAINRHIQGGESPKDVYTSLKTYYHQTPL